MKICVAHRKGTPPAVGKFFQEYVVSLLGLRESKFVSCDGELDLNKETVAVVEIKASDNNHHFRISLPQLEKNLELAEFPYNGSIYCLIGYANRSGKPAKSGTRRSLLYKCKNQVDLELFLSEHMNALFVMDAVLIGAFAKKRGTVKGALPCQPDLETVTISRRWLTAVLAHPKRALRSLGLKPDSWHVSQSTMGIEFRAGLLGTVKPEVRVMYAVRKSIMKEFSSNGSS